MALSALVTFINLVMVFKQASKFILISYHEPTLFKSCVQLSFTLPGSLYLEVSRHCMFYVHASACRVLESISY
jgi:hypothetical protein